MIISKTTEVKINAANFKHYKQFYDPIKCNQVIKVKINELTNTSIALIKLKCDNCEIEKEITFKNYKSYGYNNGEYLCRKCKLEKNNLEKYGVKNVFQIKEVKEKIKETNLEKYGVENPSQSKDIQKKIKETNLEKYGVEYFLQSEDVHNRIKETNLEKYGVENVSQINSIKEKKINTCLKNYGVEYSSQSEEIKNKIKETNLEKYGVEHNLQSEEIKNKIKETNLGKYGFEVASKDIKIKNKVKETNLEKYGVDNFTKSEQSKINTIIGQHSNYIKYVGDNISLFKCDLDKDHEFEIYIDNFHSRLKQNIPLCTICYPISENKSIKEKILLEYIQSIYSGEVISGYRDALEIDIYLPELKLGIEFNGLYWHSEKFKESNYHINKLNYFKEKDIDIKFIWEDDFDKNLDIIKSQISNWLSLTQTKIYARKTEVRRITNVEEYRNFLNKNHIQGYVASKLAYGLYYQDQLVSLMCFDKKEGRLNMEESGWNLNRFCNLINTNVIGGASKLLNHFIKINKPSRIISYADKDWSNGNLYFKLGFDLVSESKPDYKYIVDGVRKSKQNFTKTKLAKLGHDISLTESQIMSSIGINRVYDCGKIKFEKYV
jgi:hypothetical protein